MTRTRSNELDLSCFRAHHDSRRRVQSHFASRRSRGDPRTDAAHAASTSALQRMVRLHAAPVSARLERAVATDTAADGGLSAVPIYRRAGGRRRARDAREARGARAPTGDARGPRPRWEHRPCPSRGASESSTRPPGPRSPPTRATIRRSARLARTEIPESAPGRSGVQRGFPPGFLFF